MCGIIGCVSMDGRPEKLRTDMLRHRGPDDSGAEAYGSAVGKARAMLGSTRLSILDLSSAGHMPMAYPGLPLAITYNGEAYNFAQLRAELRQLGEEFFSGTDTEVLLRGYKAWGDRVVDRLQGMFAFALWDGRGSGRLLLARDRFGEKPLYYRMDRDGTLWFTSELKAALAHQAHREIDATALDYYLSRGYPPPDRCLLKGWQKLRPGHTLEWREGKVTMRRYWAPPEENPSLLHISAADAARELRERLEQAVKARLVADVPVGALLSGGVDSTSIVALMAKLSGGAVRTYTACFGAAALDESEGARQSALWLGTEHRAVMINPRAGRLLPFIASQMDEPIADPSAIATYLICRRARQEVTVLLTGDGSDELLLGYPRYRLHALAQRLMRLPAPLRRAADALLPSWPALKGMAAAPEDPLRRDRYWLDHAGRGRDAFLAAEHRYDPHEAVRHVLREDVESWLVEDVLTKLDKMSMAASVEARSPFLDPELAGWAMSLPVAARMSWHTGKTVLRNAMRGTLPPHLERRPKRAFLLPMDEWLRSEWQPMVHDVLLDPRTLSRGWVEADEVRRRVHEHTAGRACHGRRLYQLLVLEFWARTVLDEGRAEPPPADVSDCARELPAGRPVRKVCVIAPAGIGDTIRLTPAIRQLGRSDPAVSVTIYTDARRPSCQVMAGIAPVDRHVQLDFHGTALRKLVALVRDLRRMRAQELASTWVSVLAGPAGALSGAERRAGWVPAWSPIMRLTGLLWQRRIAYEPAEHTAGAYDASCFRRLLGLGDGPDGGLEVAPPIWEEAALKDARRRLQSMERPVLAVSAAAAANMRQREYPLPLMARALRQALEGGIGSVALFGDEEAACRLGPLREACGERCLDVCGHLSIAGTAALMRECDAALAVDGGLLHVALSTDLPVVALYGPTEVFSSDPRPGPSRYTALSAHDRCGCRYAPHRGLRARAECRDRGACMATIPPDSVADAVAAALNAVGAAA